MKEKKIRRGHYFAKTRSYTYKDMALYFKMKFE